jgi:lycopene beta-cyclase
MGHWTYFVLIVGWAGPVIVMQWLLGLDLMWKRWKVWIPGILIPTLYLTFVDSFALRSKTWTINPDLSLGLWLPFGVPVEEGIFFLMTNALVVQGMILLSMPGVVARVRRLTRLLLRGPRPEGESAAVPEKGNLAS